MKCTAIIPWSSNPQDGKTFYDYKHGCIEHLGRGNQTWLTFRATGSFLLESLCPRLTANKSRVGSPTSSHRISIHYSLDHQFWDYFRLMPWTLRWPTCREIKPVGVSS